MSTNKSKTVWVLTQEYNDYDQHGCYFEAVFAEKPSLQDLANYFKYSDADSRLGSVMDALEFLEHLRNGGGRRNVEHNWYYLEEVELR